MKPKESLLKELDLNDVRAFAAVGQEGTLTAAAKYLQLPTSTVSRALTRLEKHLGVLLVQRSPRGVVFTDSGKAYLQSCRGALQTLIQGRELLEERRTNPSGLLKVACPVTMSRDLLAPLLKEFLERFRNFALKSNLTHRVGIRNPGETSMFSLSYRHRRIPCDGCGRIRDLFEDFSPAPATSRPQGIQLVQMTSPSTVASVSESGNSPEAKRSRLPTSSFEWFPAIQTLRLSWH